MAMDQDDQPDEEPLIECREPTLEDLAELCGWLNDENARYVVVGGFAVRAAGYNRRTMDVDLLIDTSLENEAAVIRALAHLPDKAAQEINAGEVSTYGVLRVADEYMVDLMREGCGVDYSQAAQDAETKEILGVKIPFASPRTLWRMKQTVREKDIPDRLFLRKWAEAEGVTLDPPPATANVPPANWLTRLLNRWLGH